MVTEINVETIAEKTATTRSSNNKMQVDVEKLNTFFQDLWWFKGVAEFNRLYAASHVPVVLIYEDVHNQINACYARMPCSISNS